MRTTKQQARLAGFLYLLLLITAPLGLLYVPSKLIVSGDATATAAKIRASEGLFRMGMASELVHQIVLIFVVLALYELFRKVDEGLSRQLVVLGVLLSLPIVFVGVLFEVGALLLLSGAEFRAVFEPAQLEAMAYLFLRLNARGITLASIFWGLWLFPFGILVIRSRFIPRLFGYLLMIAGSAYLATAFCRLIVPAWAPYVGKVAPLLQIAEVPIIFWLAIWGAKTPPAEGAAG